MSSAICPRFAQNAWKKDLCSNCFKSKEEHKSAAAQTKLTKTTATLIKKTESAVKLKPPPKGIIKGPLNKVNKNFKVNFTKELTQVIGYGGEWSDADSGDEDDFYNPMNANDDLTSTDDDDNLELKRLTKNNTDFNTNNGNLLGDPEENIKKTFAALKLGAPLVDKEGKKQTLKISVVPFGAPSKLSSVKAKFEQKREDSSAATTKKIEKSSISAPSFSTSTAVTSSKVIVKSVEMKQSPKVVTKQLPPKIVAVDGKSSPPIERAMEKSLLEEISETLELKHQEVKKFQSDKDGKIKFEISSLSDSMNTKTFPDLKKPIARNAPITKDQIKPKINVFTKFSDSESNCSDNENGISAYYDVVETTCGYENLPDGKSQKKDQTKKTSDNGVIKEEKSSVFSSSQYITDMLLSAKTRAASYSLHEGNFMTSKITSDGLIVTKCSSDDALDSTGSSFDGSSDEETSYNMNRSESDSGIGISIGNEYKVPKEKERTEKKLSASTNNSDYEDIQVIEQTQGPKIVGKTPSKNFLTEKSRESAGEPDGSADPDGNGEVIVPALPKTPPPITAAEVRPSFLHGMQKNIANKKPDLPVKPTTVSVLKTFTKRQPTSIEKQVITQLQQVIKAPANDNSQSEKLTLTRKEGNDHAKLLKKGRAPDPPPTTGDEKLSAPPTPEKDYSTSFEYSSQFDVNNKKPTITTDLDHDTDDNENENEKENDNIDDDNDNNNDSRKQKFNTMLKIDETSSQNQQIQQNQQHLSIYTRNPIVGTKTTSPVIREKDKRERATINPKFRSLNTFNSQRNKITTQLIKPSTPEPTPRKNLLSMSEECLTASSSHIDDKKKKTKFSIKKFLRMGTSKTTDNLHKKDGIYSEIVTGDEAIVSGKPRLVIIHPIDINPTAVEVVKDMSQTNESTGGGGSSSPLASPTKMKTVNVLTTKPPAPPQRALDSTKSNEINKPARPPPPKSAELRRKQKIGFNVNTNGGSVKCKSDNVYANLGEIRSAMAPRKPERTASMREREAQLELARKRHGYENSDTISICSSNGGNVSNDISINPGSPTPSTHSSRPTITDVMSKESFSISLSTASSRNSTTERRKQIENDTNKVSSKLEIFEKSISESNKSNSLKDSVRKINSTIDSYLKDKRDYENMYDFVKTSGSPSLSPSPAMGPPTPPARSNDTAARNMQRRMHFQDNISVNGANYTRSEYGPRYGLTNSLANIPRVISASYCGSEMGESDIYSPYSYYGSEAGGDVAMTNDINDSVWGIPSTTKSRTKTTNRLRMRKGRSVVHKTIEDNYSAVVVANHEALAQVLDQLQQTPVIPPALRSLANAINLRFEDFTVLDGVQPFVVGKKAFHAAVWTSTPVSLALSVDCNQLSGVGGELSQQLSGGVSGVLNPITEFCDLVPSYNLPLMPSTEVRMLQATISVLPRLQLETLQSIGMILKNKSEMLEKTNFNFRGSIPNLSGQKEQGSIRNVCSVQNLTTLNEENLEKCDDLNSPLGMPSYDDVMCREVGFIMLQLVNGLKNLQAKAIEEMPLSLSNVVLSKEIDNKDAQARLCVIQGNNNDEEEPMGTLCKCAHVALTEMLPQTKLTPILSEILIQERSESLSKAKAVLEFALWGPSDVILTGLTKERELALQRWLDLERATVLHGLVRTRIELTVYDECHLMFLVRSNAKMMNDAAKIFSSYQNSN